MTTCQPKRTLPASFLSDEVHTALLDYLDTLPEFEKDPEDYGWSYNSFLYDLYLQLTNQITDICFVPPPFRPFVEKFIIFYITKFAPYFARIAPRRKTRFDMFDVQERFPNDVNAARYLHILFEFIATSCTDANEREPTGDFAEIFEKEGKRRVQLGERWKAGLMREGQVILIQTLLDKLLVQLSTLIELETENERLRYIQVLRICKRETTAMFLFFASPKFRSEGLEARLMKYLREEEVNWDVVRALEARNNWLEVRSRKGVLQEAWRRWDSFYEPPSSTKKED
ncbi:hypothetical protein BJ508DRAFT_416442 [Ascobolus immersus RN42]|uniref:Uncharacterized protein n=1 Tax=Ascobolus immersus RN42 TaxID=1160509 RepID=A0A3N4HXY6_ASCIM|nr:hypothetical protein BJ508DRAFT_416442 [Ascobolus immersus RN42]